jgi:hypothetical protein
VRTLLTWSGLFELACFSATLWSLSLSLYIIRDLKQTGRQRDDDGYSHNDIPDLVQKKLIIMASPTGVREVVLGLFTKANQRLSRFVYNANMSRHDKYLPDTTSVY